MISLQLSISKRAPKDRNDALNITNFNVQDVPTDEASLHKLFTSRIYSTNQWKMGKCLKENFLRMSGITLDIDKKVSIAEAKELFKDYNYIIHTSTSHRIDIPRKDGIQDRYRIILPFSPADYALITTTDLACALYDAIEKKYPFIDPACKEPARKYFPFLNNSTPEMFELYINDVANYYSVNLNEVQELVFSKNIAILTGKEPDTLSLDTEVLLSDGVTKKRIREFKKRVDNRGNVCYCPYCDDAHSESPSAFVEVTADGRYFLRCSHCVKTYWLSIMESFPELFYLGNTIYKIHLQENNVAVDKFPFAALSKLPDETKRDLDYKLATQRSFAGTIFKVQLLADGYAERASYKMIPAEQTIEARFAPIPVKIKDNEFIENWLKSLFPEEQLAVIRPWMAIWAYENFQPLPMLILNGARSVGKSTFGGFLQTIYPNLVVEWRGIEQQFSYHKEKKLFGTCSHKLYGE